MSRAVTLHRLAELAEDQWGLFTRRQAEATGMAWSTLARLARDGAVERVAHGVYRLRGSPPPDNLDVRAAWLQLAPDVPAWERTAAQGVVSHRSAAALYGLGELPADVHHFTLPVRRQSQRTDIRLHQRRLADGEWTTLGGLFVTRPARIAADLLAEHEDPGGVGRIIADALRSHHDYSDTVARALAPHAAAFGLRRGDGLGLLEWLLDLAGEGVHMTGVPEDVPPLAQIPLPGLERPGYRAYPLVDHIADKTCAIFERHGPEGRPSTRYKDLVDLVMLAQHASVAADMQRSALVAEGERRGLRLPERFDVPDRALWEPGYAAEVRRAITLSASTLHEALAVVSPFLDPLLAGSAAGTWCPDQGRWGAE